MSKLLCNVLDFLWGVNTPNAPPPPVARLDWHKSSLQNAVDAYNPLQITHCCTYSDTHNCLQLLLKKCNVINSSKMNSLKTIQEFSRTPEDIQGQQDLFQVAST